MHQIHKIEAFHKRSTRK